MARSTTGTASNGTVHVEPGDDHSGLLGGHGVDDTAPDDNGGVLAGNGADDTAPDDQGAVAGGHGADDPTGAPHHSRHFSYTDTATHGAGDDDGVAYTGPVTYLEHEYGWSGHDGRAVASNVTSAFIHGGDGDDAIAVIGGNNVLDGGAGSNFLVGAHGDDGGKDVFFVDVRGGQTVWDTVVNMHHDDMVTIWGYRGGVSTMTWSENEGAEGYKGATLHAEIEGAGTGVTASVTFAGLSVAEAQSKLGISTGNVEGNDYMLMHHG